jgi:hypothetical protein
LVCSMVSALIEAGSDDIVSTKEGLRTVIALGAFSVQCIGLGNLGQLLGLGESGGTDP